MQALALGFAAPASPDCAVPARIKRAAEAAVAVPAKTCLRVTLCFRVPFRFMRDVLCCGQSSSQKNGRGLTLLP
jgi:hypothetical protein